MKKKKQESFFFQQERADSQKTEFNPSNFSQGQTDSNKEIKARIEQTNTRSNRAMVAERSKRTMFTQVLDRSRLSAAEGSNPDVAVCIVYDE